jgi:hypothetical protein
VRVAFSFVAMSVAVRLRNSSVPGVTPAHSEAGSVNSLRSWPPLFGFTPAVPSVSKVVWNRVRPVTFWTFASTVAGRGSLLRSWIRTA